MSDQSHRTRPFWGQNPWKWLFSLRVGLWLLFALTVASIAGTFIQPLDKAQALVYYSWWYKYLLLLPMAINMACATVRTILEKTLPASRPRFMRQPQFYLDAANRGEVPFRADAETASAAFRRRGFRVFTEGALGYAVKGTFCRWGAPISHLGIVIVLLGGFASAWFNREGGIFLPEGGESDMMVPQGAQDDQQVPMGFTIRIEDFETGFFPKTQIPSKFVSQVSVKEPGGAWRRDTVEVNHAMKVAGWELHQSSYRAINDWERYLLAVKPAGATTTTLEISPGQRRPLPAHPGIEVALNQHFPLAWTVYEHDKAVTSGTLANSASGGAWSLRAERFEPDFVMSESISSRSRELNNPALQVTLLQNGAPADKQWLFGREDMKQMMRGMHEQKGPFTTELMSVDGKDPNWICNVTVRDASGTRVGDYQLAVGQTASLASPPQKQPSAQPAGGWNVRVQERIQAYATYLTLTRNPMVPVIYFGCGVMLLGLMIAFFTRSRQVWFRVDPAKGRLYVAALYRHQAQSGLDRATRAALGELAAPEEATPAPALSRSGE